MSITINSNGIVQHARIIQQPTTVGYNTAPERPLTAITQILTHHAVSSELPTMAQVNAWWNGNRWNRSGYAFLIRGDGSIWQLAPLRIPTWGAGNENPHSLHICFAGNFAAVNALPSQAARNSYGWLVRELLNHSALTRITANSHVRAHKDVSATVCPGFEASVARGWIPTSNVPTQPTNPGSNTGGWTAGDLNAEVRVTSDTLNVRAARNATSAIRRTLRRGDVIRVRWILGINNANPIDTPWGAIDGATGFINMNHVERVATQRTHTVVFGDTLWGISQRFNVTVDAIQRANNMKTTVLSVGQILIIPN